MLSPWPENFRWVVAYERRKKKKKGILALCDLISFQIVFQGVFEQRFAKMPDEHVEMTSAGSATSAQSAAYYGLNANSYYSLDKSRSAEVQQQVGSCKQSLLH